MSAVIRWTRLSVVAWAVGALVLVTLMVVVRGTLQPRVERAVEATAEARRAHEAMLDQETGLRGFLLSGDERFLEPYRTGRQNLSAANARAGRLLTGERRAGELLLEMRLAQQAWLDGWADQALERRRSGENAVTDAFLEEGKVRFDAYRQSYDALVTHLVARRERALRDQGTALLTVAGAAVLATGVFLVHSVRRGRALRSAVGRPLDELLARLERLRGGDFTPQPPLCGPTELEVLGAGVAEAAAALAVARTQAAEQSATLAARGRQLAEILRLAQEVAGSLNLRYVLRGVCSAAAAVTDGARVVVWLRDGTGHHVEPYADSSGPDLQPIGLEAVSLGTGIVGQAARFGRTQQADAALVGEPEPGVAVPMVVGAQVIGVLEVTDPRGGPLPAHTIDVLQTLAIHAATAIEAARLHEHTETMALTDALTGLPNRRRLEGDLAVEVSASLRYSRPLSFVMVDVDQFKSYNDSFGHQAGDAALQALARVLAGALRGSDTIYRYGGEEIVLLLRETALEGAVQLAERLRAAVEHHFAGPSQPRRITISLGVAALPDHGPDAGRLVAAADAALYEAKRAGRNRVVAATPPAVSDGIPEPRRLRSADKPG